MSITQGHFSTSALRCHPIRPKVAHVARRMAVSAEAAYLSIGRLTDATESTSPPNKRLYGHFDGPAVLPVLHVLRYSHRYSASRTDTNAQGQSRAVVDCEVGR